jgi:site-specific DNA recombinase
VRQVFAWLIEDQLAVAAITRRLNGQGVPTRHGCATWAHSTVYRILTNRLYMGEHAYNKTESTPEEPGDRRHRPTKTPRRRLRPADEWIPIPWPALISPETFALAQRQLHLNGERSPRRMRSPYLLAGLLICGYCGRRLAGHAGRASRRYECTRRRSWAPRAPRCPLRSIHQADIEPVVWEQIRRLLSQPELILAHVRAQQAGEGPGLSDGQRELKRLEQQQAALARQEQRLLDAYQLGAVELEELKTRRQHLRATARQLEERAQLVRQQIAQLHQAEVLSDSVTTFCAHIQDQLVEPSFGTKQKLLRLVVERIVVTNDQLTIEHIIPSPDGRLHLRRDGRRSSRRSAPPPATAGRLIRGRTE